MNYYSLHHKSPNTTFKNAVVQGLAKDRGIYFPETITPLSEDFIQNIANFTNQEIAYEVIKQFIGDEIPTEQLKYIIKETVSFDFPVVDIDHNTASLELFHGPTMAFKDVGATFMARCLEYFNRESKEEVGIDIKKGTCIGQLSPVTIPVSYFRVTPFVFIHDEFPPLVKEAREVQEIICCRISDIDTFSKKTHQNVLAKPGITIKNVPGVSYKEHFIWGATALILHELNCLLKMS